VASLRILGVSALTPKIRPSSPRRAPGQANTREPFNTECRTQNFSFHILHSAFQARLGRLDSNQDPRLQRPVCCHCTTPQSERAVLYHKARRRATAIIFRLYFLAPGPTGRPAHRSIYPARCIAGLVRWPGSKNHQHLRWHPRLF
jgi:hypothetical protein